MSEILIKNARIVNEGKIFNGDLLIKGDIIYEISKDILIKDHYTLINAKNKLLIPGVIDDQVHFREPGTNT